MTGSEISEVLTRVSQAVDVPAVDEVAFRTRVRRARRRRTAGRLAVGGVAAAAAAACVALVATGGQLPVPDGSGSLTDTPGESRPSPTPQQPTALSLEGELYLHVSSRLGMATDLRVEEVLGSTDGGVVVVDRQSRVVLVPVGPEYQPGEARPEPRPLADGAPVTSARLDRAGKVLAFVDLAGRLHLRDVASDRDLWGWSFGAESRLAAVDGERWVENRGDELVLGTSQGRTLAVPGAFSEAELGGQTLAASSGDQVRFFDVVTGRPFGVTVDASHGSLAPTGTAYAAGVNLADEGKGSELSLVDNRAGSAEPFGGWDPAMSVLDVRWQNDDRLLVLAGSASPPGTAVLWDCSAARMSCRIRLEDPSGTMRLPSG